MQRSVSHGRARQPEHTPEVRRCARAVRGGHAASARRGVITLELLMAIPVLVIATLAVIEFGFVLLLHEAVTTAAIEGAREGQQGGGIGEVTQNIEKFLAVHNLTVNSTSQVRVVLERRNGGVTQTQVRGNAAVNCTPVGPPLSSDGELRVTVGVELTNGTSPVPDWLASLGFSLVGRTLCISSLGRLE